MGILRHLIYYVYLSQISEANFFFFFFSPFPFPFSLSYCPFSIYFSVLGLPYDPAIDVWSVGCTLYELFTGKILFPGRSNNQMLRYMMEVKGKFSHKMLRRGQFAGQHFDENLNFLQIEVDRLTNKEVTKKVVITRPTKDLKTRLMTAAGSGQMSDEERALLTQFVDLLDKCLSLNPEKRISVKEALAHPFCTGKV